MLRAFNYGAEFYAGEEDSTPKQAWDILLAYAQKNKLTAEEVKAALKGKVEYEKLVDQFEEAYKIVYELAESKKEK
jgi:hypothetical protein